MMSWCFNENELDVCLFVSTILHSKYITKVRSDATDISLWSTNSTKNPVTIPYVIFNLSSDAHIYLPKGTIVAHPDEN